MINNITLLGRICNDLELKYTAGGTAVLRFNLAVERNSKEKATDFIPCLCFGSRAETIAKYFKKGRLIALVGALQTGSYEKDGKKTYTFEVLVNSLSFTGEAPMQETNSAPAPAPTSAQSAQAQQPAPVPNGTVAPAQSAPVPNGTVAPAQSAPVPNGTVAPAQSAPVLNETVAPAPELEQIQLSDITLSSYEEVDIDEDIY